MESFMALLGLVTGLLAVSLVHGASVTVSRNITVKPTPDPLTDVTKRVDITLECIGSQSDLSYYIKNQISWSKVTDTGQTVKLTDGFYSARESAQYFNGSLANYSLEYKANTGPGYMFRLTIKGVKYSDDGEYTCTLISENKAVADKKTVKVTVVHPVDSVMLSLYDSVGNKVKDSNAPVTDDTEAIEIKPGKYRAECKATGSNPAPRTEIRFDTASIAVSETGTKSVVIGRPSYASLVTTPTDVAAMDMDQLFTCEANIPGTYYVTRVASIKVKAIIDKPDFLCDNLTRSVGDNHVEVKCVLNSESELTCDKVTWELAEENFEMHVNDRYQEPNWKYGVLEVTCSPINSTALSTSFIVHQAADPHFQAVYYVKYEGGAKDFKHYVSINKDVTSSATLLAPLTFLATIVMAAASMLL